MMEEEFRKLAKSGKERLGDGEVRIKELSEQEQALKEIEKKKALYELELFEWGEQCRKVQSKITRAKYENQIELAKRKIVYDEELDKKRQSVNTDARKFIAEIERNIHAENTKLSVQTTAQRMEIGEAKRNIAQL